MMSFFRVIASFAAAGGVGLALGTALAVAARSLTAKKDRRVAELEERLPGQDCGVCGYAGCSGYAGAIAGEAEPRLDLCLPGGGAVAAALAALEGAPETRTDGKLVTQVHCRGGRGTARYKFEYSGVADCSALHALYGGDKVCSFACLGLGSCIRVCPVRAIGRDAAGLVWVDKDRCTGCGRCVEVCPSRVMRWVPGSADYIVACSSTDDPQTVKSCCSVGCIGCKICENKSPEGGFKVEGFLSRIDYGASGGRKAGAEACPPKCIVANTKNV
jgi:Na+-translocating ferredoxin:NAD+ oxidoreductase subunit B